MSTVLPPPHDIQLIGGEMAIRWADGVETYLPLEKLRRCCPCAACQGEPDVTGKVESPLVTYNERSFALRGYRPVGGYAVQMVWQDGHESGLYSYQLLRRIGADGTE